MLKFSESELINKNFINVQEECNIFELKKKCFEFVHFFCERAKQNLSKNLQILQVFFS